MVVVEVEVVVVVVVVVVVEVGVVVEVEVGIEVGVGVEVVVGVAVGVVVGVVADMNDLEAKVLALQAKNVELLLLLHDIREKTLEQAALEFSLCKSKKLSREAVVNTLRIMARSEK